MYIVAWVKSRNKTGTSQLVVIVKHIEVAFPRRRSGSRQKSVHTLVQDRVLYQLSWMPGPQAASRVRSKPPSFPVQFSVTVFLKSYNKEAKKV